MITIRLLIILFTFLIFLKSTNSAALMMKKYFRFLLRLLARFVGSEIQNIVLSNCCELEIKRSFNLNRSRV